MLAASRATPPAIAEGVNKMLYTDKFNAIKKYVKLDIVHNKKNFTKYEKNIITRYYNKLENLGYLNPDRIGYVDKNISNTKYRVKGAPKLKTIKVDVGTSLNNGKIETSKNYKIKIENGILKIKRGKMPYSFQFQYNYNRDWKLKDFVAHLKNKMAPYKMKKGYIFVIGAGMYEMTGGETNIENLAKEILKIGNRYGAPESDSNPNKFLGNITVYENRKAFKLRKKNVVMRKRKRKKKK